MYACVFVCLLQWDPINGLMDGWMTGLTDCQYLMVSLVRDMGIDEMR